MLLCTVYSSRATRKTLVKCCVLFSADLMGSTLCDFLILRSEVRTLYTCSIHAQTLSLKEASGLSGLLDAKVMCPVVAAAIGPWLAFLVRQLNSVIASPSGAMLEDHVVVKV